MFTSGSSKGQDFLVSDEVSKIRTPRKAFSTMRDTFVTIDPGCRINGGTGLACFDRNNHDPNPFHVAHYRPPSEIENHDLRVENLIDRIKQDIELKYLTWSLQPCLTKFYIERPQYFDSFKGQTAAQTDSLFKLIFFYGRLFQLVASLNYQVIAIKVPTWKGQLSKQQVSTRVHAICGKKSNTYKGDVLDAVGIGLFILGKF